MRRIAVAVGLAIAVSACGGDPCGGSPPRARLPAGHVLLDPEAPALKQIPPDTFDVVLETTQGTVVVRVFRDWSPLGAYRFYNLARNGFYDGSRFYRVIPGFIAQFGMSGDPTLDSVWLERAIPDDPRHESNRAGTLTFATAGPDTRSTQLFFNYTDNEALDDMGFTPIGRVVSGMDLLYRLHSDYGDVQPRGRGPDFGCLVSHGNAYLDRRFPLLDHIRTARVTQPGA